MKSCLMWYLFFFTKEVIEISLKYQFQAGTSIYEKSVSTKTSKYQIEMQY